MKPYSSYKDSGIAWIGQIPSHWEIKGLRSYLTMISEKGHGDKQLLSVTREQGVIVRNTDSKEENHNFIPDDLNGYKLVKKGQFAINKMKSWQGSYGVSEYEGIVSPAYFVCDLTFPYKPFFSMAIRSKAYIPFFTQYSKGIRVDQWDLSPLALKSIPFIEPPVDEQEAIVRFITEKSEKIDRYIAEQERLLATLDELRQAEIARAVTRGLNPDAPLRDSGIDWIGQIPAHWEIAPMRSCFSFSKGLTITKANLVEKGIAVLSYGQIHNKINTGVHISEDMIRFVPDSYLESNPECLLQKGDFIFADTSEDIEGSGNCAFNDFDGNIFAGYHTVIARPLNLPYPKYTAYLFQSKSWKEQVHQNVNAVKVYSINRTILRKTSILMPPLDEQQAIVEYLDAKTAKIDSMKADIQRQIGLLKEYKQRIIADAVTGKIDVRE